MFENLTLRNFVQCSMFDKVQVQKFGHSNILAFELLKVGKVTVENLAFGNLEFELQT
jgi:hypothetical protein